jgi:hypothetical protein
MMPVNIFLNSDGQDRQKRPDAGIFKFGPAMREVAYLVLGKGRHPVALALCECATYALAKTWRLPLLFKGQDFAETDIVPVLIG